jgi:hypothetical protein
MRNEIREYGLSQFNWSIIVEKYVKLIESLNK